MGAQTPVQPITEEEYLSNPAYEHSEYAAGRPEELNLGTEDHSTAQTNCAGLFWDYLRKNRIGYAATELHCKLTIGGEKHYRLPDVCVVLGQRSGKRYLERAPDLTVEVRSPEDTIAELMRKFTEYFANGCKLGWLILPEEKSVLVLTPSAPPRAAGPGETRDGGEVLPGLQIPVDELFA